VRKEDPLTVADSEPEPDVSVVTGKREDYAEAHPSTALLVVEVAVTSESSDRELIPVYAGAGVAEFWIILAAKQQIECFTVPSGEVYLESRVYGPGDVLTSGVLPGFALRVAELFA
jgi:Uma2 family endonuclease